jgi:hypothetical protein
MFDTIFKIVPPSLLFSGALYAGVCALWLQPLVEQRLADRTYVPQCEAGVLHARTEHQDQIQQERESKQSAINLYKDLLGDLGELPGVERITEMVEDLAGASLPELPTSRAIASSSPCSCAVGAAFEAIKLPMLLHVMSARTYQPAALQSLPHAVSGIATSGQCGSVL